MNKNQMVQGWEKKMDAGLVSTGIPERMWDGIKSWVIYTNRGTLVSIWKGGDNE